ncbi:MAG: BspA family leucine-rich repeat surface protein [Candidatus Pacearchaeota archaeon]
MVLRIFNGDLSNWDTSSVVNMYGVFYYTKNFNGKGVETWDTSKVTNMGSMFQSSVNFASDLSSWEVSEVENIAQMFLSSDNFSGDLSNWNMNKIENFKNLIIFHDSKNFSGNLSNWDVSNVKSMDSIFFGSRSFSGDLSNWDTSNVTDIQSIFLLSDNFSSDLSSWDMSSVTNINYMFMKSKNFSGDLSNWNLNSVILGAEEQIKIFENQVYDFNGNLSNWRFDNIHSFDFLFVDSKNFRGKGLNTWDTSNIKNMHMAFYSTDNFSSDLSNWNVKEVNNIDRLFFMSKDFSGNLSGWKFDNLNSTTMIFEDSINFSGDVSDWKLLNLTSMSRMFAGSKNFSGDASNWELGNITEGSMNFDANCINFSGDLSNWKILSIPMETFLGFSINFNGNLSNWTFNPVDGSLKELFFLTKNFSGDLSNWNISKVENMNMMFHDSQNFNGNLNYWNTTNVESMKGLFYGSKNFSGNLSNWNTEGVIDMSIMFIESTNFSSDISNWNVSSVIDMSSFAATGIPTELYDKLLIGWGYQELQEGIVWDLGNTDYTKGNPENARNNIITKYGWTINDGEAIDDVIAPKINIISPIEGEIYSNNNVQINLDIYDVNLKEIYYNYNGLNKSYNQLTTETFDNGEYNLQVWAIDDYDNLNYSNINFNILGDKQEVVDNQGSGNTGTGIAGYHPDKYLEQGYVNDYFEKDAETFSLNQKIHKMTIEKIKNNKVTIKIESEPRIKELEVREEWRIDFEMDGVYDLYVKVNSIEKNKANITIKQIRENYSINQDNEIDTEIEEESPRKEKDYMNYYFVSAIVLILNLLTLHIKKKKKK